MEYGWYSIFKIGGSHLLHNNRKLTGLISKHVSLGYEGPRGLGPSDPGPLSTFKISMSSFLLLIPESNNKRLISNNITENVGLVSR